MQKTNQDLPKPSSSRLRCAIYTRKSTEEGLDQEFNSLDAQREAAESFVQSQRREGWIALPEVCLGKCAVNVFSVSLCSPSCPLVPYSGKVY